MDGLSGAASVIAVLQLTVSVGAALKDYYEGVRDARDDIHKLYGSIKGLERTLERLKDVVKDASGALQFEQADGPLVGAKLELSELAGKLNSSKTTSNQTRAQKVIQSL
jgi:hypothetical protein